MAYEYIGLLFLASPRQWCATIFITNTLRIMHDWHWKYENFITEGRLYHTQIDVIKKRKEK